MKKSKSVKTDKRKKNSQLMLQLSVVYGKIPQAIDFLAPFYHMLRLTGTGAQLTYHLVKGGGWGTPVVFLFRFCFLNRDLSRSRWIYRTTRELDKYSMFPIN